MLSIEQKKLFSNTIITLCRTLDAWKTENTLQELERFENRLTLNELEECFFDTISERCETKLIECLAQRWERVWGRSMCYTQKSTNAVNQLCLKLAMALSSPITTPAEIEVLEPNTGPYCLLMPSLENSRDVYGENIHNLQLHEFVLSDNARVVIPLVPCLHQASISDAGQLRHVMELDGQYPELTPSEIERVSKHSKQSAELYQSILALNTQRVLGEDIGAKLNQLVVALRSGGAHRGRGSGTELNAGAKANLGILTFNNYWQELSEQKKAAIFTETPELSDIIGRLFRPEDVNYKETRFCVELLANELDPIIETYNRKPSIQILQKKVKAREGALKSALKKPQNLVTVQKTKPPKHILHLIFKLSATEQKKIFKYNGYENALMYALAHEPEALPEFELDEKFKQQVILARIKPNNYSALIVAAKLGAIDTVKLLLRWGSDVESYDMNNSTALHWAASCGHVDMVTCLLDKGALLEARGWGNNTPLNFAVRDGRRAVVELLLKKNAHVNVRNSEGKNALDIAIEEYPEFIEPILMQMASLSADEQAECLLNVPGGPYPNVFFYIAAHQPALFDKLVVVTLEQPGITPDGALFITANRKGYTLLTLAAQTGACESIRKLLAFGLGIESHDANNSTALHWAASRGHIDVVTCLLDNGALLEARGWGNNTPLNFAVRDGRRAVVELLLKKNANVNARNNKLKNALDIAIEEYPEFIEPLLMQVASLSADEQMECLLNAPGGPYPNVFFYAAHQPALFDKLVAVTLEQPGITPGGALFTTANQKGYTLLILAAQTGACESIRKLLAFGLGIESHDANNSTALHWAASCGHIDVVTCLLDKGALLEARGWGNNTPLNFAVRDGRRTVVKLLLKKNANVNVRNSKGQNALDIAIAKHPEFIEPILMQMATLPVDEQAKRLLNVPGGPYPNVFFYAATINAKLLKILLHSFNNNALSSKMQHIHEHISQISLHYQKMIKKYSNNSNYRTAVSAAETLLKTCIDETLKIYQESDNADGNMLRFINNCSYAIKTARPVLTKYREWGKVLAAFLLVVMTLPISLPLYAVGFFSVKTKSEQLLDKLQSDVNKLG